MDYPLLIKTKWSSAKKYIEDENLHSQSEKFAFIERYWYQLVKNILFAGGNPFASSEELESYVRYSARLKWSLLLKRTAVVHRVAWKRRPKILIKTNSLTEIQQSLYQMAFGSAMDEAEEKARREQEEKARREQEEKAQREQEEKAQREQEEKARREQEEKAQREIRFILSHFYYGQRTAEYPKEFHAVRSIMLLMIACGFVPQKAHERSDDYFEYYLSDILKTYHQVKDIVFMKKKIGETYRFPWVHNHIGCIRNDTTYKVFIEKISIESARLRWWWYWYLVLKKLEKKEEGLPFFMMPREIRLMIRNRL